MRLRSLDDINQIIIHCSATPNGEDWRISDIDDWHKERGFRRDPRMGQLLFGSPFNHVGYHDVIHVDGVTVQGRSLLEVGAHTIGQNANSIGICLIGTNKFTLAQWEALKWQVSWYCQTLGSLRVAGHEEFSAKTCPNFDARQWAKDYVIPESNVLLAT